METTEYMRHTVAEANAELNLAGQTIQGTNGDNALVAIDRIVEESGDQADMTIALYKHVFPEWDSIISINGYPFISMRTSKYILGKFEEKGWSLLGTWFNSGFGSREGYTVDWTVCCEGVRVEMVEE